MRCPQIEEVDGNLILNIRLYLEDGELDRHGSTDGGGGFATLLLHTVTLVCTAKALRGTTTLYYCGSVWTPVSFIRIADVAGRTERGRASVLCKLDS